MADFTAERTTDKYLPHRYAGVSGDFNPIHIDPEFAKQVGFERNILHGLCTLAFVAKACVDQADGDPRSLKRLKARFSAPVFVEQKVTIDGTSANGNYSIEAVSDSGNTVISNCEAEIAN